MCHSTSMGHIPRHVGETGIEAVWYRVVSIPTRGLFRSRIHGLTQKKSTSMHKLQGAALLCKATNLVCCCFCFCCFVFVFLNFDSPAIIQVYMTSLMIQADGGHFQNCIERLMIRSRIVSEARDRCLEAYNRIWIWMVSRQYCCRTANQISKQREHFNTQSCWSSRCQILW